MYESCSSIDYSSETPMASEYQRILSEAIDFNKSLGGRIEESIQMLLTQVERDSRAFVRMDNGWKRSLASFLEQVKIDPYSSMVENLSVTYAAMDRVFLGFLLKSDASAQIQESLKSDFSDYWRTWLESALTDFVNMCRARINQNYARFFKEMQERLVGWKGSKDEFENEMFEFAKRLYMIVSWGDSTEMLHQDLQNAKRELETSWKKEDLLKYARSS